MSSTLRLHGVVFVSALALFACVASAQEAAIHVVSEGGVSHVVALTSSEPAIVRETSAVVANAALRSVAGARVLAATWDELDVASGSSIPWFALSLDGRKFHEAQETSYDLLLRYRRFDPLAGEPEVEPALRAAPASRLWIVQYWTQGLEDYRDVVRGLGGQIHLFLANQANVVEADAAAVEAIRALPFVRWVGRFHPAYKLDEILIAEQKGAAVAPGRRRVNVLTMRRGPDGHAPVNALISAMGGRVTSESPETHLLSADLTPNQTLELAHADGVQWIDLWSPPEDDMDIARDLHGSNYLETNAGFTGTGVRGEVLDGGCDLTHPDLAGALVHGSQSASDHGTCTSGIVFGTGSGNAAARGGLPAGQLVVADYGFMTNRYNHTSELQNAGLAYKCVFQSNSWGGGLTVNYTSVSQDMDLILFDHQRISILQSQSNAGTQSSRPEAWAKNIISVGGIRHANTLTKADDTWNGGASIGPGADGRLKPDVASFYEYVLCTDRVGTSGYATGNYTCVGCGNGTGGGSYTGFSGTSSATPICAGHLGLLYQMWSTGSFGNPVPGATVFDNRANNTTMKALLINTSTQWPFVGVAHDLTRTHQGWGHPDVKTAWDLRMQTYVVDETDVLTNLGSTSHFLNVLPGSPAFKATMVYRDKPGTTSSTLHRINNMNLKVTSPGGTIYWGNNGLAAGQWSTSGGVANNVDTVENVFVQNPQSGSWLVEVIAAEVNQDTHVETPQLDSDYALVVTGVTPGPPPATIANFTAAPTSGPAPHQVVFTDTSTGAPTSWSWTFGDGATSTSQNPSHTYATPGNYTVTLAIDGPNGPETETKPGYIVVGPGLPMISSITPGNVTAFLGGTVTITGSSFTGATQVQLGSVLLTAPAGFAILNDTSIAFTAPNATVFGPVSVTVTTPVGTSAPGSFTYVETVPAKLSGLGFAITGSNYVWNYGAGANDAAILIASLSPATFDFGTPYQILLNFTIIAEGSCNGVGIGSSSLTIPPGLAGSTFYSQVAGVDVPTNNFTVSNITSTFIIF